MNQTWSWVLATLGATSLYFVSRKSTRTWGWAGAMSTQILWMMYGLVTRQWGFLASALVYGFMHGKNLLAWRREKEAADEP